VVVVDAKRLVGVAGVVVAVAVVVAVVGSIGPCRRGGSRAGYSRDRSSGGGSSSSGHGGSSVWIKWYFVAAARGICGSSKS